MIAALVSDPALLVGLVRAGMILAVSFGVAFTQPQQDAVLMFTGALLAVLSILLTGVTRAKTTPVASPALPQGSVVTVVTPGDLPNHEVVL